MNQVEKVKKLGELFELVQFYYEHRDRPLEGNEDFHAKLEQCCQELEIDLQEFRKEFKLYF